MIKRRPPSDDEMRTEASPEASDPTPGRRRGKPAKEKIMDFLARRDHSERELRAKLSRHYETSEIEEALEWARGQNWMSDPQDMAVRVSEELHRKRKGWLYISHYLRSKGLPPVPKNLEIEVQKGLELVTSKLAKEPPFDYEDQKQIHRWLANRGFDEETIRKVMYEKS